MQEEQAWEKVIYRETSDIVRCVQGYSKDLGDFLEISGDEKIVKINKRDIVSIHKASTQENKNVRHNTEN